MWSQNVDSLEFRVYRVRTPFSLSKAGGCASLRRGRGAAQSQAVDAHRALPSTQGAGAERGRSSFRAQYTRDSRESIHGWLSAKNREPVAPATSYPGLPLLNPQQVVSVWRQNITSKRRWDAEGIPIPVNEKGLYLVEAARENLRAYTVVIVTDLAILTIGARPCLSFVTDRASRAPVANCPLMVWSGKKEIARVMTDSPASPTSSSPKPIRIRRWCSPGADTLKSGFFCSAPYHDSGIQNNVLICTNIFVNNSI